MVKYGGSEPSERTKERAFNNALRSMVQLVLGTALMAAMTVAVALTLQVAPTVKSTACELRRLTDVRQSGDTSQGECVRGRTQWDAVAIVYVTVWQQIRNATISEATVRADFDSWKVNSSYTCA